MTVIIYDKEKNVTEQIQSYLERNNISAKITTSVSKILEIVDSSQSQIAIINYKEIDHYSLDVKDVLRRYAPLSIIISYVVEENKFHSIKVYKIKKYHKEPFIHKKQLILIATIENLIKRIAHPAKKMEDSEVFEENEIDLIAKYDSFINALPKKMKNLMLELENNEQGIEKKEILKKLWNNENKDTNLYALVARLNKKLLLTFPEEITIHNSKGRYRIVVLKRNYVAKFYEKQNFTT